MASPRAAERIQDERHLQAKSFGPIEDGAAGRRLYAPLSQSRLYVALRSLRRSPVGMVGLAIIATLLFLAVLGPEVAPHDATKPDLLARFQPPVWSEGGTLDHPLGTDQLGRDILSRLILGSRVSVIVGISSVLISTAIGVAVGLVAGFYGQLWDSLLMRVTDAFLAIPFLVLVVAVAGVIGPGLVTIILILGFTGWVSYCRVVRGEVLALREYEYVSAARALGQRDLVILARHILPNVMASVIVLSTLQVATSILAESSLSFLGLGVQPPTVTWGGMLADGRQHIGGAWWLATFPGITITITILGIVFLGDWLRDVLDPRLRD